MYKLFLKRLNQDYHNMKENINNPKSIEAIGMFNYN